MTTTAHSKYACLAGILIFFALFPFFEGGESPAGLLIFHSLTLALLTLITLQYSRLWIPRFLLYFLPFLGSVCISALVAPYKYAALLQFWDYICAGLFTVFILSTLKEAGTELDSFTFYAFLLGATSTLISVFGGEPKLRISGSFTNPNDFGAFSLLLLILGLFQFEHETDTRKKILISLLILALSVCMALASSRSVFLAGGIFVAMYFWKRRPGRALAAGIAAVLILCIGLLVFRFWNFTDPFQYYRLKIWKHSLQGIVKDPYLGIGLNMLPYQASKYNFPADLELGRYARVARTADNQYFQILAETGFLGLFTFVIGWIALFFALRRVPDRLLHFRYSFLTISIIGLFSLPLNNTSVLFLFLFLVLFPISVDPASRSICISFKAWSRIAVAVILFLFFAFCVYFPFKADHEFKLAMESTDIRTTQAHLKKAVHYNPFQPYFRFAYIKRIVEAKPEMEPGQWKNLIGSLNDSIRLNPLESDFYLYRAKIFRTLFERTADPAYSLAAISDYQAALDKSPYNVLVRGEFALFLSRTERLDAAESELSTAISMEPAYLGARYLLAEIQFRKGNLEEARKSLKDAEMYYHRYKNLKVNAKQGYIRRLLQTKPEIRESVKRLILDAPQN